MAVGLNGFPSPPPIPGVLARHSGGGTHKQLKSQSGVFQTRHMPLSGLLFFYPPLFPVDWSTFANRRRRRPCTPANAQLGLFNSMRRARGGTVSSRSPLKKKKCTKFSKHPMKHHVQVAAPPHTSAPPEMPTAQLNKKNPSFHRRGRQKRIQHNSGLRRRRRRRSPSSDHPRSLLSHRPYAVATT